MFALHIKCYLCTGSTEDIGDNTGIHNMMNLIDPQLRVSAMTNYIRPILSVPAGWLLRFSFDLKCICYWMCLLLMYIKINLEII